VEVAVRADKSKVVEQSLAREGSRDPGKLAVEFERLGRHSQAAAAFQEAGMPQDALRNWREAGEYEKALPHAKGKTKADLQWMISAEKLMHRRPKGIQDRLEAAERKRLGKAMRMPMPRKTLFG
jgi:hypothetical protein